MKLAIGFFVGQHSAQTIIRHIPNDMTDLAIAIMLSKEAGMSARELYNVFIVAESLMIRSLGYDVFQEAMKSEQK